MMIQKLKDKETLVKDITREKIKGQKWKHRFEVPNLLKI